MLGLRARGSALFVVMGRTQVIDTRVLEKTLMRTIEVIHVRSPRERWLARATPVPASGYAQACRFKRIEERSHSPNASIRGNQSCSSAVRLIVAISSVSSRNSSVCRPIER